MAISPDKAHVNIEFVYESIDGDAISVRFHNTDMGETISLSEDKENWYDFPAALFMETIDYLRSEHGLLGGKKPVVRKSTGQLGGVPAPKSSLSLPKIVKKSESSPVQDEQPEPAPAIQLADVKPVESLTALASGNFKEADVPNRQVIRNADEESAAAIRGGHNEDKGVRRTG
tara:strand:- start:10318 stop:10836 length:519 start_codon:yes stop_codon:yes gene_type:complete